ncbi:hypothetical protein QFW77_02010 [Luteimonas sp. RD2P54]|uniref:DUF883 domain-containing protein n=1 Tax=Luteimonas endophytica TaxID=3042023 RepID=A0ABT6J4M9_9GAMM|nr:hypothetical protein [Luteimonas endophytica]MDH5821771.1 hypothetical protein [Luteimonas endophytica]
MMQTHPDQTLREDARALLLRVDRMIDAAADEGGLRARRLMRELRRQRTALQFRLADAGDAVQNHGRIAGRHAAEAARRYRWQLVAIAALVGVAAVALRISRSARSAP